MAARSLKAARLPDYVKPEHISLKNHPQLTEKWVQARIAEDPSILGLGDLILRDSERIQPRAGRLDLLLQDPDSLRRYEVEIQLGRTDETHIIRTIEYWDIERKRYPQYDHCAVLVAEDITSRFRNVAALFNGAIPLVAIQMQAMRIGPAVSLIFTTVLSEVVRGFEEDDDPGEPASRAYWEKFSSPATLAVADALLVMIHEFAPELNLKYNKFYIGLGKDGQPFNFAIFYPKKQGLNLSIKLRRAAEVDDLVTGSQLDVMDYDLRNGRYRFRLTSRDLEANADALGSLLRMAYDNR